MSSAPPPRILHPTNQNRTPHIRQRSNLAITKTNIQMLSLTRIRSRQQCSHNRIARVQPRRQVRHRDSNFNRRAISATGQMHQTEFSLHHYIEAGPIAVGTCLAVARDTCVDESWVDAGQGLVV